MLKGTRCDYCDEEITVYGYNVELNGIILYFCSTECRDEFIQHITETEDVVEPEDYNV